MNTHIYIHISTFNGYCPKLNILVGRKAVHIGYLPINTKLVEIYACQHKKSKRK